MENENNDMVEAVGTLADFGTAATVAALVERLDKPELIAVPDDAGLVALPAGRTLHDLRPFEDARRDTPRRRTGTSKHTTLDSFLEHVERTRDDHSVIFASDAIAAPSLTAIYDYNERTKVVSYEPIVPTPTGDSAAKYSTVTREGSPRFGTHRAHYAMPFAEEFKAWATLAGPSAGWLSQLDFAHALEDRVLDVLAPSDVPSKTLDESKTLGIVLAGPSSLLSLSRGLLVKVDRKVGEARNLSTGEAKISFVEEHTASDDKGNTMVVPNGFALSIPVFVDGDRYALLVRLRYRISGSAITWKLALHRSDIAFRDAFFDVTKQVRDKSGLPLFFGAPE